MVAVYRRGGKGQPRPKSLEDKYNGSEMYVVKQDNNNNYKYWKGSAHISRCPPPFRSYYEYYSS